MRYYPIFLDITGRPCLVVGGGAVGTRKVETLVSAQAQVTVVSPEAAARIISLADAGQIQFQQRNYRSTDMDGMFLAVAATGQPALNRQIQADAVQSNTLLNIADMPEACHFILPAVIERGDLMIAVSTSGHSPALARKIRKKLETEFGMEYVLFLKLLGEIRKRVLRGGQDTAANKEIFDKLVHSDLQEMIKHNQIEAIDRLLAEILGPEYTCQSLLAQAANDNPQSPERIE